MTEVHLRGPLRQRAGGRAAHTVGGATVVEALRALEAAQPSVAGWILDERGRIRRHINVFVNGEMGAEGTAITAADRLDVIPAISGGAAS